METESLEIRPYRAADEAQVIALWRQCDLVVPWNDPRRDIAAKLQVQPELFLVGLQAGQIVATVMAGYDGHRGWINYLAVAPDVRRRGVGRRIMAEVEARLRELGCPKINLQVRIWNTDAVAFYERVGFSIDAVVSMGKRLG